MFKLLSALLLIVTATACHKPTEYKPAPLPVMEYKDLGNITVGHENSLKIDLNNNGTKDIWFYTEDVADILLHKTYLRFYALSLVSTALPMNEEDEAPVASTGQSISATAFPYHQWWPVSAVTLAQKVSITNGPVYWEGLWQTASHRFLPFATYKNGTPHYGWIELSFDAITEKLTLHRFAISTEANKGVKAGW